MAPTVLLPGARLMRLALPKRRRVCSAAMTVTETRSMTWCVSWSSVGGGELASSAEDRS